MFLWAGFGFTGSLVRIFRRPLPVALDGVLAWALLRRAQASPAHSLHVLDLDSSGQEAAPAFPCAVLGTGT